MCHLCTYSSFFFTQLSLPLLHHSRGTGINKKPYLFSSVTPGYTCAWIQCRTFPVAPLLLYSHMEGVLSLTPVGCLWSWQICQVSGEGYACITSWPERTFETELRFICQHLEQEKQFMDIFPDAMSLKLKPPTH